MILAYIIGFTLIGSVVSLFGSYFLLLKRDITETFSNNLVSFAAGALITVALLDLLPEAVEEAAEGNAFILVLVGFVGFFFAEKFIRLFHHHHGHGERPTATLVLIGDGIHNFIDGVVIAVAFLASIPLGITTALAVAAHEIPQEIADMGVLLSCGLSKVRAIVYNFLSAITALLGAVLTFLFADVVQGNLVFFLAIAAGSFIYISASDLIPQLHENSNKNKISQVVIFLVGIASIYLFGAIFEG